MCHSWFEARQKDHMKRFRQYVPSLNNALLKPSNTGRKHQLIQSGQSVTDIVIDRHEIDTASNPDGGSQENNSSAEEI